MQNLESFSTRTANELSAKHANSDAQEVRTSANWCSRMAYDSNRASKKLLANLNPPSHSQSHIRIGDTKSTVAYADER